MRATDTLYDLLSEYLQIDEDSISLVDQQIDNDIQLEYFEYSKNLESQLSDDEIIRKKDLIFDEQISTDEKKVLLVQLASLKNVEAYRTIEKYLKRPNNKLYDWAYLALLENRMRLESTLLNENKALITTGLGGKGNKLRYFIVFFTDDGSPITKLQKKIILSELNYAFKRNGAEVEEIIFEEGFASFTTVIPLHVPVQDLFNKIVKECNEFGGFLFDDYIITNIKVLDMDEIQELLALNNII
ncbi:MAG: hypothetical protein JW801_09820 [Bacteroidales bacterium]|nr:hypothetical protein [Bacteroidales bacterium]